MLLERVGRRLRDAKVSRRHPTAQQAYDAVSQGLCLYAVPGRNCSSRPKAIGLRDDLDDSDVLVCKGHFGALRHMDTRRLDELERALTRAFAERRVA